MKRSGTCPKCQSHAILHVHAVADQSWSRGNAARPVHANLAMQARNVKPLIGASVEVADTQGRLEAYACGECGYVEQYLVNSSELVVDGEHVSQHVTEKKPYR